MARRVLLVDDDHTILKSLGDALGDIGLTVERAASAEEALSRLAAVRPDAIVSDIRMPGMDGIELLSLVRERLPDVDVVLMTAYDDMPTVVRAMREGAFDFLVKPIDLLELEHVVRRALEDRRARERERQDAEDEARPYRLDELIGRDPKMIEVFKIVGQLAASPVNALIRGETGTGKEMVARAIHFNSAHAEEPFVPVNCTALPDTLLESELFGHVRGAFTGAVSDRRGRFALAGRGTIFLDEIGDTSPEFQAKILRVLEDGEVFPVGAEEAEPTQARVIAATHRDLEQRVEEGSFRDDLYYRLRVVEIELPPLRERPADIPDLAHHLVRKAADKFHAPGPARNVRELENCLTRAMALATGGVIRPHHLALGPRGAAATGSELFPTMEKMEIEHTRRVLDAVGGNKTRAAQILGISKPRLYRLLARESDGRTGDEERE
jgi:DNA-binding NtrC family response regulator